MLSFVQILRRIAAREFDLIVVHPTMADLSRLRRIFKCLIKIHTLAPHVIFFANTENIPVVLCDMVDTMVIHPRNFIFFSKASIYFKRELPQNNWHAFLFTTKRNEDVKNIARQLFFQSAFKKLRPFPLTAYRRLDFSVIDPHQKTMDVFYVGENPKTTVRMRGLEILKQLRAKGWRIDLPEERISQEEFQARIARAWLVWSPEGRGWECYRHHEAFIHGAVPVMNYPTIDRYKPFIEGRHAFYYGCEDDDLVRVIEHALSDTSRLTKMIQAGREHLQQWYTGDAILRYVLEEVRKVHPHNDSAGDRFMAACDFELNQHRPA